VGLIGEKTQRSKISCYCPFKEIGIANKLGKWTVQAILAGADNLKFG
jgi:hypothetical protein